MYKHSVNSQEVSIRTTKKNATPNSILYALKFHTPCCLDNLQRNLLRNRLAAHRKGSRQKDRKGFTLSFQ